ncbi:MAG TPA: hypothetical protein VIK01_23760 [Polyangiaceae bacterium]
MFKSVQSWKWITPEMRSGLRSLLALVNYLAATADVVNFVGG